MVHYKCALIDQVRSKKGIAQTQKAEHPLRANRIKNTGEINGKKKLCKTHKPTEFKVG